jgi:glutathione-regulated potassium-efflux system ancillary protein KefC
MDPLWLIIAFAFGFLVSLSGLPPMIGYLLAGFFLNIFNIETGEFIKVISDLGVTLLLFTIGLKLKLRNLAKPEVSVGSVIQMLVLTLLFGLFLLLLSLSDIEQANELSVVQMLIIAFALSFSSTVFAVKVLDERGENNSLHGVTAIGILIIQDLIAVIFLVATAEELPGLLVFALPVILLLIKPIVFFIMKRIGHGELLILFGFFLALIPGAELFKLAGLKPDLGALVLGMIVAGHPKAKEMAASLLNFKDLFLIGFFLTIGITVTLSLNVFLLAVFIALAINIKVIVNYSVLTRFGLRARTSYFTSLSLANYSEFGLIIAAVATSKGWISQEWLGILAISLSMSFIISSPLNSYSHDIFVRIRSFLTRFETKHRLLYDRTMDIGDAEVLIFGMGQLGTSTYDHLIEVHKQKVLGLDYNSEIVEKHRENGRMVIKDDATDLEFWERVNEMEKEKRQVKMVILCLEDHKSNLFSVDKLRSVNYTGKVVATANHDDEVEELKQRGVDAAYNLYEEAGIGLADQIGNKSGNGE